MKRTSFFSAFIFLFAGVFACEGGTNPTESTGSGGSGNAGGSGGAGGSSAICGDGAMEGGETCDDENTAAGDGCAADCVVEEGYSCAGTPSVCTDDDECATNTDNCDANATCANTPGSFTCTCNAGFDGDGVTCSVPLMLRTAIDVGCVLFPNGTVKCWGGNYDGRLGQGDTANRGDGPNEMGSNLPAVDLGTGKTAKQISLGDDHVCALLNDGSVKCWGANDEGQLGIGDKLNRGDEPNEMGDNLPAVNLGTGKTATFLAAGYGHTCAILNDGTIKCWGYNHSGQLGRGDTMHRGAAASDMGDNLPPVDLGLSAGKTVVSLSAGDGYSCALLNDGNVKCWGYNLLGQLGLGDMNNRGDAPGEMGAALPAINLGTGKIAKAIAVGIHSTCALLNDDHVKCWGAGGDGQLGQGDANDRGDGPGEMGDALPAIDLGAGKTIKSFAMGRDHSCAILNDDSLKCWGYAVRGQLGLGDINNRGDVPGEMGDTLPVVDIGTRKVVKTVVGGGNNTCVVLTDDSIKCWGDNSDGQLGQGDMNHRGDEPGEMGDALPAVAVQ